LIYPDNIGENLSIDEVSLSKGELYTFVTNKLGKGKKRTLVASVKGTKSQDIIAVLEKIPLEKRKLVKAITQDMANNMQLASKMCFPESYLVTDRFTRSFYLNFGNRDIASLNSCCENGHGMLATFTNKVPLGGD